MRWIRSSDPRLVALEEGRLVRVLAGRVPLCFARINGALHAFADRCPHQGRSFEGGTCEEGHIICPWHRMRFDPVSGRQPHGMTGNLEVYPVEERDGTVRVGLPYLSFRLFGVTLW